jgi:hypothetical protein
MLRVASSESLRALGNDQTSRSLLIRSNKAELILYVPSNLWPTAERVRDEFKVRTTVSVDDLNEFELFVVFLKHSLAYLSMSSGSFPIRAFVKLLFTTLHVKYLGRCDPHTCIKEKLGVMDIKDVLCTYYTALDDLQQG